MKVFQAAVFLIAGLCAACGAEKKAPSAAYEPREGDIFFQSFPHSPLTDTIEGVTKSPRSHCGILRKHEEGWVIMEAIQPVRETPWPTGCGVAAKGSSRFSGSRNPTGKKSPA